MDEAKLCYGVEDLLRDRLDDQVAFTVGYSLGQGHRFPTSSVLEDLRERVKAARRRSGVRRAPLRRRAKMFAYDYAKVAEIARAAIEAGESPARAVHEQIDGCASVGAARRGDLGGAQARVRRAEGAEGVGLSAQARAAAR